MLSLDTDENFMMLSHIYSIVTQTELKLVFSVAALYIRIENFELGVNSATFWGELSHTSFCNIWYCEVLM